MIRVGPLLRFAVARAGQAVVAAVGPLTGGVIVNPATAVDQGIAVAENLYVDLVNPAGTSETGTTETLAPGQSFSIPAGFAGTAVSVNAATAGHRFSGIVLQGAQPYVAPPNRWVQTNATVVLPSYLYWEYSDDEDLQAFVAAYNQIAQGYLDWFNATPLALYTGEAASGPLLDWIGTWLYDVARPVLGEILAYSVGAINTFAVNTLPTDGALEFISGNASPVSDDVYKRVLTWWSYAGDGRQMSIDWIKRRVSRFLYGVNGSDVPYPPPDPPSVTISYQTGVGAINTFTVNTLPTDGSNFTPGGQFLITAPQNTVGQALQALVQSGLLALPFENTFAVVLSANA